jgi:hypothetical protein
VPSRQQVTRGSRPGQALGTAAASGTGGVIDPAQTRQLLIETLARTRS